MNNPMLEQPSSQLLIDSGLKCGRFSLAGFLQSSTHAIAFMTLLGLSVTSVHAEELGDQPLSGDAFFAAQSAMSKMGESQFSSAVADAKRGRALAPNSEFAARLLVDALTKAGQPTEAIQEAKTAIAQGGASGQLLAQLGYLTQASGDRSGAMDHFRAALSAGGLTAEQETNVENALVEARFASVAERAYAAAASGEHSLALSLARKALLIRPGSEGMASLKVNALAQRGYLRLQSGDYDGAQADFEAAQASNTITSSVAAQLRYAMADARALSAETKGNTEAAIQAWQDYLSLAQSDANGWFSLGFLLIRSGKEDEAALAFEKGLEFSRRGNILLQLGSGYLGRSAPKASSYLREVIDAKQASDPTLHDLTDQDLERVRNQITQSDASLRTTVVGSFGQKDTKTFAGVETALRFDGRYLPSVAGLEAYVRGSWSRDETKFTESDLAVGLRWQPFSEANFVVGSEWQHRIDPSELDQLVINWGYSHGGIFYPYEEGGKLFTTAGAFGSWRLGEERYLQNLMGSVGYAYSGRSPYRYVIAPSIALDASYDSEDNDHRFALGVGPALDLSTWLGGDDYSSYDFHGSMQVKYLIPIGASDRQSGWRLSFSIGF